ncbi:MAG: ATP-dependent DNA ligase [Blastococcus sp.]
MDLPVLPPVKPMLAKPATTIPTGDDVFYEPKWDGFRCIVFRDGDEVELGSRNERPLTRYFPEVVAAVKANLPEKCVVDGEIVVPRGDRLHFEDLLQRIHPAASRVNLLAEQTPASFVAFDLLALGDESLLDVPFVERQARLRTALAGAQPPVYVTAITKDADTARRWFETFEGAGLDGVLAKKGDLPYGPDQRLMTKIKHVRTADCVVAGFRWHKSGPIVGSLLLGLYNDAGALQHIGVAASFPMARRAELVEELAPYRENALEGHPWQDWADAQIPGEADTAGGEERRMPGAVSRWNAKKDLSWVPLRPELVVEIKYDQLEGRRLRHTGQFLRWRPDRDALSCTYDQLDVPVRYDLNEVLDV